MPDAYEFRLLLAEDFGERIEWAMNWFFEQEIGGDRGREWGVCAKCDDSYLARARTAQDRCRDGVSRFYRQRHARPSAQQFRDWPNDRVEADKQYALGCLTALWLHG